MYNFVVNVQTVTRVVEQLSVKYQSRSQRALLVTAHFAGGHECIVPAGRYIFLRYGRSALVA